MLSLATFNLKDFFPQPPHDFAPKVACVAEMLARVDADVVALQEVGAPDTLEALLSRLDRRGGYGAPIVGTADARGIRCALLSRVPVLRSRVHTAPASSARYCTRANSLGVKGISLPSTVTRCPS